MVSIEKKLTYLQSISGNHKLTAFNHFLVDKDIINPKGIEISESDEIYYGIISAIQSNNKLEFEQFLSKKSKSNPSKESPAPFVYDDFLVFSIIIGVSKFKLDKSWIKNIVSLRSKNPITITFDNLLSENYYSKSNQSEIVLMFFQQINQELITNEFLNSTFKKINENTTLLESKSDFQILCTIHSYNSIILMKETPDGSEIKLLKAFNVRFIKRMKILSSFLQLGLLFGLFFILLKLPVYTPETIKNIDKYGYIFNLLGAVGLTLIGNQLSNIKSKTHELTMRLFGYSKELIIKTKENR